MTIPVFAILLNRVLLKTLSAQTYSARTGSDVNLYDACLDLCKKPCAQGAIIHWQRAWAIYRRAVLSGFASC